MLLRDFDPNQPRDDDGRWTDTGGGGDAGGVEAAISKLKTEYESFDFSGTAQAGYLFPDGSAIDIFASYGRSHEEAARRAGTTSDALYEGGAIRIGTTDEGMEKSVPAMDVYARQPLTQKQRATILRAIKNYRYRTFHVSSDSQQETARSDNRISVFEARNTINAIHPEQSERDFDPNQPRDERGRWTDTGASSGGGDDGGEEALLIAVKPNSVMIDRWREKLEARDKELEDAGLAGNPESAQIGRLQTAINSYLQESDEALDSNEAGFAAIYDVNTDSLRAAAFTYVRGKVATIQNFGALSKASGLKALQLTTAKFADHVDRIEAEEWADEPAMHAIFEAAGFENTGKSGGRVLFVKSKLPGGGITERLARIERKARDAAVRLKFDPNSIEFTDENREFTLAGKTFKYAGSYTFGEPTVKLYTGQLHDLNTEGVAAHEIGHRKFHFLTEAYKAETALMMKDPGPPPDPDGEHYWQRKGGTDAMMRPDGLLREPYDQKYPIYQEWTRIHQMGHAGDEATPTLEASDGITPYSRTYWEEWAKGRVTTDIAFHETIAEMERVRFEFGTLTGAAKSWRSLYALMDKVWNEQGEALKQPKAA